MLARLKGEKRGENANFDLNQNLVDFFVEICNLRG